MTEYQERPGADLGALVFVLGIVGLSVPLYGYLVAWRFSPPPLLALCPSVPVGPVLLGLATVSNLSRRVRRGRWTMRSLPVVVAALGWWLLPERVPVISPWVGFRVHGVYAGVGALRLLVPSALHALAVSCVLAAGPAAWLRRARAEVATVAHGSARWATEGDARAAGLLGPADEGLHLGHVDPEHRRPLTDASDHHVLVFAPPGVGKTTALVIPTLLRMRSSAWVLDPKGELWEATADWRRRELGHECLRFAPADAAVPAWNPLLEIPRGPGDVAVASLFARNLVVAPAGGEVHWTLAARSLWTALALHVRWARGRRATMAVLRATLSAYTDHDELFDELAGYEHDPGGHQGWLDPVTGEPTATHPEVMLLARKFRATPPRERGSIVSTLAQYLDPWGDPQIAAATAESHLSLAGLLSGQPTTLYLSIPFHDLGRLSPLIRLQLAALGRRLTERSPSGLGQEARRLEVVVDEFASLGRLPIMEELLAYFRGYDARCFLLCQDLSQLHRLYGRNETITGNCRVHVTTATQAPGTRRHASALAGTATARYRRTSRSHGMAMRGGRRTSSMVESSRPLLTEGEVGTLDLGQALVFKAGMPPLRSYLRPYFRDPELAPRTWRPVSHGSGEDG